MIPRPFSLPPNCKTKLLNLRFMQISFYLALFFFFESRFRINHSRYHQRCCKKKYVSYIDLWAEYIFREFFPVLLFQRLMINVLFASHYSSSNFQIRLILFRSSIFKIFPIFFSSLHPISNIKKNEKEKKSSQEFKFVVP